MRDKSKSYISAQQVADLAGVSRSQVSRAFTPSASVSPKTRAKVMAAATTLGYHVNHLARGLLTEQTQIVCIITTDLNTPYQGALLDALSTELQHAGKVVMVINTRSSSSAASEALRQSLNYRAEASIIVSGQPSDELTQLCLDNGQHVVVLNREPSLAGVDSLDLQNQTAATQACQHLATAGCRQLALVTSGRQTPSLLRRAEAFIACAEQLQLPVHCYRQGDSDYETGKQAALDLLTQAPAIDGVFCVTDLLACGFMDAARFELGRQIPEDLCIIGFDNIEQASWASYQLTTFAQPLTAIAKAVVEKIVTQSHASVVFSPQLIRRQTLR